MTDVPLASHKLPQLRRLLYGLRCWEFPGFYFQLQCQHEKAGPMKLHSCHCSGFLAMPTSSSQNCEVDLRLQGASCEIVRDSASLEFVETSANSMTSCHLKSSACCSGQGVQGLLHLCSSCMRGQLPDARMHWQFKVNSLLIRA